MKPTDLAKYMQKYLAEYLPVTRGLSTNTIASRRDTFTLLFEYLKVKKQLSPDKANIRDLDIDTINGFLNWLESERHSSTSTRNLRLTSLKTFFKYIQNVTPDYIYQCQLISDIPLKKVPEESVSYMTLDGIKVLLESIATNTSTGFRDLVMLSVMYDCGARVQEIADLCVGDVRLQKPETIRLTGKGRKTRVVPLMSPTVKILNRYIMVNNYEKPNCKAHPLFLNRSGDKFTRAGITYVLKKYVSIARKLYPNLIPKSVSPHHLRHSRAMHMLQAGVPLIYIRDFLGHSEISTTEIYARCDSKQKREAFEAAQPEFVKGEVPIWQSDESLLHWLRSLC